MAGASVDAARQDPGAATIPGKNCPTAPDRFEASLLDAIRISFSKGPLPAQGATALPERKVDCPPERFSLGDDAGTAKVIFALLPDPVHTNLPLFFDRQIDSVQQGAQDCGWVFEQGLMPWDNRTHPESNDFRIRNAQEEYQQQKEKHPGLMIFWRRTANAASESLCESGNAEQNTKVGDVQRLLVFVIGESPVRGVNKPQFQSAVELVRHLFQPDNPPPLRILGPTFSGSLQSLADILDCGPLQKGFSCQGAKPIPVFSGTVTGCESAETFKDLFKNVHPGVKFETLQEYDEHSERLFFSFVENRGYVGKKIAVLSEDETGYGSGGPSGPGHADCKVGSIESEIVHLYFPREISQFRNAYQNSLGTPERGSIPRSTLPSDLASGSAGDDTVAQFSGRQLPLSQESLLLEIVSELRKHGTEIIMLRATNPLDQLFLAKYLRQAYPQGRIVTLGADLLFSREVDDSRLHGVMALATYALSPGDDHRFSGPEPEPGRHNDRVFSGSDAVGTHNAMMLLMDGTSVLPNQETGNAKSPSRCPAVHLALYKWPALTKQTQDRPPVHLSVLGHQGFWDIAALAPAPATKDVPFIASNLPCVQDSGAHSPKEQASAFVQWMNERGFISQPWMVPASWELFGLIVLAITAGYVFNIWSATVFSGWEAVAQLAPSMRDSRKTLFAVTAYVYFALLAVLSWASLYFLSRIRMQNLLLGLMMILVTTVCARDLRRRNAGHHAGVFVTACILTMISVIVLWFTPWLDYKFAWRAVNLSSGVSPLLPILTLLGAMLWGVWHSLAGSAFADQRRPALPKSDDALKAYRSILHHDQKKLRRLLKPDRIEPKIAVVACVVLAAGLQIAGLHPVRSLEPIGYEIALALLVAIVGVMLISGSFRLWAIWTELRRLLLALDGLPLRRAFKRINVVSWSPLWRMGAGSDADFRRLLSMEYEAFARVTQATAAPHPAAAPATGPTPQQQLRASYELAMDNWLDAKGSRTSIRAEAELSQPGRLLTTLSRIPLLGRVSPLLARASFALKRWLIKIQEQRKLDRTLIVDFKKAQTQLAVGGAIALKFLDGAWQSVGSAPGRAEETGSSAGRLWAKIKSTLSQTGPSNEDTRLSHIRACEEFLTLLYYAFIMVVVIRIRTLVVALGGMYVFLLLSMSVYPFQPQVGIRISLVVLLVGIIAVVGIVYAQMHRDTTLSYLTSTRPGELGSGFWLRIGAFVALPILSFAASQFPEISGALQSWVEPALSALR